MFESNREHLSTDDVSLEDMLPSKSCARLDTVSERDQEILKRDLLGHERSELSLDYGVERRTLTNIILAARKEIGLTREQYDELKESLDKIELDSELTPDIALCKAVLGKNHEEMLEKLEVDSRRAAAVIRNFYEFLPAERVALFKNFVEGHSARYISEHTSQPKYKVHRYLTYARRDLKKYFFDFQALSTKIRTISKYDWFHIKNARHRTLFIKYLEGHTRAEINSMQGVNYTTERFATLKKECRDTLELSKRYVEKKHLIERVRYFESHPQLARSLPSKIVFGTQRDTLSPTVKSIQSRLIRNALLTEEDRLDAFMLRLRVSGLTFNQIAEFTGKKKGFCSYRVGKLMKKLRNEYAEKTRT